MSQEINLLVVAVCLYVCVYADDAGIRGHGGARQIQYYERKFTTILVFPNTSRTHKAILTSPPYLLPK